MKQNIVERKIMWGDLDSLGIVFYPRYYEWIDGSGHLFFESIGLNLGEMKRERGLVFGLVETSCTYHKPGRYHQQLRIITGLERLTAKTLRLRHDIERGSDGTVLVTGFEHRICLDVSDPEDFCAVDIPEDIHVRLRRVLADDPS